VSFDERHIDVILEQAKAAALATGRTAEEANQYANAIVAALNRAADGR
jgi:hypothetical protein